MLGTRLRTYPRIAALCNRTLDALFLSRLWLRLLLLLLGRAPPGILGPARLFLRRYIFFSGVFAARFRVVSGFVDWVFGGGGPVDLAGIRCVRLRSAPLVCFWTRRGDPNLIFALAACR
jgi:hypothetical protein